MNSQATPPPAEPQFKKPSLLSQVVPYLFTAAILVWVFTGLSSNVVDERHTLTGTEWSELIHRGVRPNSLAVRSADGRARYCGPAELAAARDGESEFSCPAGGDFEYRAESRERPAALRRTPDSRIPAGGAVAVNYVKKVKLSEILLIMRRANLSYFVPAMLLFVLVFFLADTFSFGLAYRWFNSPGLPSGEMFAIRGAPYVIQVGLAPLAEVLFPLYMWRVKKVPVTDTVSSNLWVMSLDLASSLSLMTPAVIYNLRAQIVPDLGVGWLIFCLVFWAVFVANLIFWHSRFQARAQAFLASGREGLAEKSRLQRVAGELLQLLRTFSLARWHQYLRVWLIRFALLLTNLAANYAALRAMGVDPPLPLVIIGIPVVMFSIFMPVGVGGYGGPQLIAWYLFAQLYHAGTADQVIAYSLLFSTAFLVGRALIGLIFIRGFWKRCFPQGFRAGGGS